VGGWALEGEGTGKRGLVLRGLCILIALGRFMDGGIGALLGRSRLWVVARLLFYIAPTLGTSHRRIATVCSLLHYMSTARLVGGLPNPHPRWVGRNHSLDHPRAPAPAIPGWFARGLITFHFILPNSLNKPPTRLHRSLTL